MKSLNKFLILFIPFLVMGCTSYNRTRTDIVIYKNEGNLYFSFPIDKKSFWYIIMKLMTMKTLNQMV